MRDEFEKLVKDSAHAVVELAPRAREARLKVIWREFVAEKKKLDC
jgi:hypothetical protein